MTETVVVEERGAAAPSTGRHRLGAALLHGRGLVGLILVGTVVLLGVFAPLLAPYGPNEQIAGTDQVNRDILSRTLYGIRADLVVVFLAVPLGALLGGFLGLISSAWAGVDVVTQRVFDLVLAFPTLILAIAVTAFLGSGLLTVAVVIMVAAIPVFGRMLRGSAPVVRA